MTRLTRTQIKKLQSLSEDWRLEPEEWKSGITFYRLERLGLCEMDNRRLPGTGGDITTGPGSWGTYRWYTRRTPAGTAALVRLGSQMTSQDGGAAT